jgi:hypothetical protein
VAVPLRRRSRPTLETLEGRCLPSTVTNLNDAGPGSLRQAIIDTPSGGTVDFQPGLSGTITPTGELGITKDLIIDGPGASVITVSGNNASRVFDIAATNSVGISGLTVANGFTADTAGGGILNDGTLAITNSVVSGNSTTSFLGGGGIYNRIGTLTLTNSRVISNSSSTPANGSGGILNSGQMTVTNSTFRGNSSGGGAGAIENLAGSLTVTGSTFDGNSAVYSGGAIFSVFRADLTITNCTFSGNSAQYGGGIDNASNTASLIATDCTIRGNTAAMGGGIFLEEGAPSQFRNTIIAGNTAPPPMCPGLKTAKATT